MTTETFIQTIKDMSNEVLSDAYNGLRSFGYLSAENLAHESFEEEELIDEDGMAFEENSLIIAIETVIEDRMSRGEFE